MSPIDNSSILSLPRSFRWRVQLRVLSSIAQEWDVTLAQQRDHFVKLVDQYPFPDARNESNHPSSAAENSINEGTDMDPLTAMVMAETKQQERLHQLEMKYRKEKALRKRGMAVEKRVIEDEAVDSDADTRATLHVIDKDIHRLPPPPSADSDKLLPTETRHSVLRQVLFIYHCQNSQPGYRQGMHEIASYILYTLEVDCVDPHHLAADCYTTVQHILDEIKISYDVPVPPIYDPKPLEVMSRRILSVVHQHNAALHSCLHELSCPPQLYLTKWIRLLFSREVYQVLELWDFFMQAIADERESYSWMHVLEQTAAARLLLCGPSLLSQAPADTLHLLMNLPMEANISALVKVTRELLHNSPHLSLPPIPPRTPSIKVPPPTNHSYNNNNTTTGASQSQSYTPNREPVQRSFTPLLSAIKQGIETAKEQAKVTIEQWRQDIENPHDDDYTTTTTTTTAANRNSSHALPLERNYDDPLTGSLSVNFWQYPVHQSAATRNPSNATTVAGTASSPMSDSLRVVQDFIVGVEERRAGSVPPSVWHALADLHRFMVS
jgi:hypothetical protein